MATRKQTAAAKRNIKKARTAAKRQRTIAHLPAAVRKDMGRQAARARARGGKPGRGLEDARGGGSRRSEAEHPWSFEDGEVGVSRRGIAEEQVRHS